MFKRAAFYSANEKSVVKCVYDFFPEYATVPDGAGIVGSFSYFYY